MCQLLRSTTVWLVAMLGILRGHVFGGISLIDTTRSISISGRALSGWPHAIDPPPPFSHALNTDTTGTFNHSLQDSVVKDGFGGTAYADQNSTLTVSGDAIAFNGSGKSTGTTFPSPSQPGGEATSNSDFSVKFSLDTPATYKLEMTVVPDSTSMNPALCAPSRWVRAVAGCGAEHPLARGRDMAL